MVYRVNRDPIIDDNSVLRVDILRVENLVAKNQGQGEVSGYTSGGSAPGSNTVNVIEKYTLSTDANATDVGDLTENRNALAGQSSSTHGYASGGDRNPPYSPQRDTIDKFSFSVDGNATDVGNLIEGISYVAGQMSPVSGYTSGKGYSSIGDTIQKFPFSSDANATDVGDLTQARHTLMGQTSSTHGYTSGGSNPGFSNVIDKFPFSSDANATDVGDLLENLRSGSGQQSGESGYVSAGEAPNPSPGVRNVIQKFPFSSDANSTDVGDLTGVRYYNTGVSSTISGYSNGGWPPFTGQNTIDKFPFASDGNAADAGDLTRSSSNMAGQQV